MEPVRIRVEYSKEDFIRAINFVSERSWLHRHSTLIVVGSLFAIFLLAINALRDPSDDVDILKIILVALFPAAVAGVAVWLLTGLVNPWFLNRTIKKQIESSPLLQEVNEIEFDENGLKGSTYLGGSSFKWAAFREATETSTDLHFFTSSKFTLFVPKSGFESEEQIERVKYFVKEQLRDRAHFD